VNECKPLGGGIGPDGKKISKRPDLKAKTNCFNKDKHFLGIDWSGTIPKANAVIGALTGAGAYTRSLLTST